MSEDKKSCGEELSDMFYALQITTKIMVGITQEHDSGSRSQEDFETRWQGQSQLLCRNLAKIKPLVEKFVYEGFGKFSKPVGYDTEPVEHPSAGLNGATG